MRTPLLLAALALGLAAPVASAQPTFGLKAGLNTAFFSGDDAVNSDPRLGFVGGITSQFPLTPSVAIQLEALYSQKGETYENMSGLDEVTKLAYLEIPASVRLSVPLGDLLEGGVTLGGYLGVPLSSEVEVDGEDASDLDANLDFGPLVGVDIGSGPVYVDARYTFGLTDAIEFDPVRGSDLDLKNQVVSLTFGYRFGGGGYRY